MVSTMMRVWSDGFAGMRDWCFTPMVSDDVLCVRVAMSRFVPLPCRFSTSIGITFCGMSISLVCSCFSLLHSRSTLCLPLRCHHNLCYTYGIARLRVYLDRPALRFNPWKRCICFSRLRLRTRFDSFAAQPRLPSHCRQTPPISLSSGGIDTSSALVPSRGQLKRTNRL